MSLLYQFVMQRPTFSYIGVEPGELMAALRVLDAASEVSEKRVMGFSRREDDCVFFQGRVTQFGVPPRRIKSLTFGGFCR